MKKIVLSILAGCLAGCGQKAATTDSNLLTLDVEAAIDSPRPFDLSEIAEGTEFIPLDDSNEKGLIGSIREIEESKNRFYVVDDLRKPIKVFDKTGKFISTIGSAGRGPNEYLGLSNIAVDYEKENVYAVDDRGGMIVTRLLGYDPAGGLFARNDSIISPLISRHGDRLVLLRDLFNRSTAVGDTVTLVETFSADLRRESEIKIAYRGDERLMEGLPGGGYTWIGPPSVFSDNGRSLLIKETRCDTVFRYLNDTVLEPAYRLDMGKYFPPAEMFGVMQPAAARMPSLDRIERMNSGPFAKYNWISGIYDGERYLVVRTRRGFCIFDRNDPAGGFSTGSLSIDSVPFMPMYVRDNRLVGYMPAIPIVDRAGEITNPDLKTLAAALRQDSNPMIVVVNLKE